MLNIEICSNQKKLKKKERVSFVWKRGRRREESKLWKKEKRFDFEPEDSSKWSDIGKTDFLIEKKKKEKEKWIEGSIMGKRERKAGGKHEHGDPGSES